MKTQNELTNETYEKILKGIDEETKNEKNELNSLISAMKNNMTFVKTTQRKVEDLFKIATESKKMIEETLGEAQSIGYKLSNNF